MFRLFFALHSYNIYTLFKHSFIISVSMNDALMNTSNSRDIYTVSRLNREVRTVLETGFPLLWIEAELSNFARPSSGHWYFSLKDEAAQVKCAMFRNRNQLVKVLPANGKQVLVRARIGLYEPRGDYQIIVEHMEEAGDGALRRQFDLLKDKLASEGLFDSSHKKNIPENISRVAIITSATGAAIHDILSTLKRRYPMSSTIIYPVPVQGKGAASNIAKAIKKANIRNEVDIILLARGGGSLEDLWEFNEEVVAREIYKSSIPIVTGIGHEVDFTIADFVADQRAATPTAAAELISPDRVQQIQKINTLQSRLTYLIRHNLQQKQQTMDGLSKRLRHPKERLQKIQNRINEFRLRSTRAMQHNISKKRSDVTILDAKLKQHAPLQRVQYLQQRSQQLNTRLQKSVQQILTTQKQKFDHIVFSLDALSPLHTLKRGYAIVKDDKNNILYSSEKLKTGQKISTQLKQGQFSATITDVHND